MDWLSGDQLCFLNKNNLFENDIRHHLNKHEIVSRFAELKHLKVVNLRKCRLDYLPIFKSEKIEFLDLSCNNLSIFPEWILGLNNLKYLNLGSNHFKNLPNLNNLPLEVLKIHKNKFSYIEIPKTIKFLNLYINDFKDLPDITHLRDLEFLSFGVSNIERLPDWICDFVNLKWLSLVVNKLKLLPKNFCNLKKLIGIRLAKNRLELLPEDIGSLVNLQEITLYKNNIKKLPNSFFKLNLKKLNLSENPLCKKNIIMDHFSGINFFSC